MNRRALSLILLIGICFTSGPVVAQTIEKSVWGAIVRITIYSSSGPQPAGLATGFIINKDRGIVVTAKHVFYPGPGGGTDLKFTGQILKNGESKTGNLSEEVELKPLEEGKDIKGDIAIGKLMRAFPETKQLEICPKIFNSNNVDDPVWPWGFKFADEVVTGGFPVPRMSAPQEETKLQVLGGMFQGMSGGPITQGNRVVGVVSGGLKTTFGPKPTVLETIALFTPITHAMNELIDFAKYLDTERLCQAASPAKDVPLKIFEAHNIGQKPAKDYEIWFEAEPKRKIIEFTPPEYTRKDQNVTVLPAELSPDRRKLTLKFKVLGGPNANGNGSFGAIIQTKQEAIVD